ncbi:MAG: ARMT1-like domain-containing protein [Planctomycetaceae bacterium]|nr:ARMT1-like domain-containing protein [Planctomycetaceae bacterium]
MPISLDCVLCLARQSLEASRFATCDESIHASVLKKVFALLQEKGFTNIPPLVAQEVQRIIRRETKNNDPYAVPKSRSNELMLGLIDSLFDRVRNSESPVSVAVQLAIAGNSIDFAVRGDWSDESILNVIETALEKKIDGDVNKFIDCVKNSKHILYLLDNSGEIVCDRILIEEIMRLVPNIKITAVVRGEAVLNDATKYDANQIGLDKIVNVIDNGNDAVGTILEQCGNSFLDVFKTTDLIISKGLANYETLIEYDSKQIPQTICYLFKAKCPFISRYAGIKLGDPALIITSNGEKL